MLRFKAALEMCIGSGLVVASVTCSIECCETHSLGRPKLNMIMLLKFLGPSRIVLVLTRVGCLNVWHWPRFKFELSTTQFDISCKISIFATVPPNTVSFKVNVLLRKQFWISKLFYGNNVRIKKLKNRKKMKIQIQKSLNNLGNTELSE